MSLDDLRADDGTFRVLAIDHRDSLRNFLAPDDPGSVVAADITQLKIDLASTVGALASGVMLEPEFSIPQVIDAGALADGVGFLAALEAQGYLDDPGAGPTTILEGWSVERAAASGASAAKLLLPYHPDRPLAAEQERVAADVLNQCRAVGLPLALEPLFYDLDDPADRPRVVLDTVTRFAELGPDLLKLPFPVDPVADPDESHWGPPCADVTAITKRCGMPWAMLSGGGSFEMFAAQLRVAATHGCSGFMVGRALWGEAARVSGAQRTTIITDLITPRFLSLRAIMDESRGGTR